MWRKWWIDLGPQINRSLPVQQSAHHKKRTRARAVIPSARQVLFLALVPATLHRRHQELVLISREVSRATSDRELDSAVKLHVAASDEVNAQSEKRLQVRTRLQRDSATDVDMNVEVTRCHVVKRIDPVPESD